MKIHGLLFLLICLCILGLVIISRQNSEWRSFNLGCANKKDCRFSRSLKQYTNLKEVLSQPMPSPRDRIAIISYIPNSMGQVHQFVTMLYGSWKYFSDYRDKLISPIKMDKVMHVDLLTFCHPSICPNLEHICELYTKSVNATTSPKCWFVKQEFEMDVPYGPINSFVMFNRTDVDELMKPYKYLLRTDLDVFLSPAILTLRPNKRIITGQGGYCDPFNMKRLKAIASKLNMVHRGVHCVGSTWYGETKLFTETSKKTLEMTAHMYLNEFHPTAPGLETINFTANREGEWIRWWRPVSLLYGAELALNHLIEDFSLEYKQELDTPSCSTKKIWETPHIHCWHSDCEFQKFKFAINLNKAISGRDNIPGDVVHKIIEGIYFQNVANMNIKQYTTYIAWSSVGKYLRKRFLE